MRDETIRKINLFVDTLEKIEHTLDNEDREIAVKILDHYSVILQGIISEAKCRQLGWPIYLS